MEASRELEAHVPKAFEAELSKLRCLLVSNETLQTTRGPVVDIAVRAIPACDGAGVTLFERDQPATAAASGPLVRRIDRLQYTTNQGPCLETLRTGELRRSPSLESETRWPEFRRPALGEGVVSCLSVPLVIADHGTAEVLNLYSRTGPFEDADEQVGRRFAAQASVAVANARAYARAQKLIEQLEQALKSRDMIGQAKGIIEVRERCGPDEAFDRLRVMSQHRNIKLRDLAAAVVDAPDDYLAGRDQPTIR